MFPPTIASWLSFISASMLLWVFRVICLIGEFLVNLSQNTHALIQNVEWEMAR
jgi:hypothetical protein